MLTVTKPGAGTGTVVSVPSGINCGATCSASFLAGAIVTLTPTPDLGWIFLGWGGACTGDGACQVTMSAAKSVSASFGPPVVSSPAAFYTVDPCRVIDTRNATGPLGGPALVAGADRTFTIFGTCGIPPTAQAVSVNITVTGATAAGHLRFHPGGTGVPLVSTINYAAAQTRANNAILDLSALGQLAVYVGGQTSGSVHLILDVSGYFQ
jgi:hypothetical protein